MKPNRPRSLLAALGALLVFSWAFAPAAAQTRPVTSAELDALPIDWISNTHGYPAATLRATTREILDGSPTARAELLAKLRAHPETTAPRILAAMYHSLHSIERSNLPPNERGELGVVLADTFARFADEVRRAPGVPEEGRLAFGRVFGRFLEDDSLVCDFVRERQAKKMLGGLLSVSGLATAGPSTGNVVAQTMAWQVPPPLDVGKLAPRPARVVSYSIKGYIDELEALAFKSEKLQTRCRLVESRPSFSAPFVEKQREALRQFQTELKEAVKRLNTSVPRLTDSILCKAFVAPKEAADAKRIKENPGAVQQATEPLWKVNDAGLNLHREGDGFRLETTLETHINDDRVLDAVKASIEKIWSGSFTMDGRAQRLRTQVTIRKLAPGETGSGAVLLEEGASNCANAKTIYLSRTFCQTTPGHEFGHTLGIPDAYKVFYDPARRTFLEVQDQRTVMGCHTAPVSSANLAMAVHNLLQRGVQPGASVTRLAAGPALDGRGPFKGRSRPIRRTR
jgi:hypothetical protein